MKRHICFQLILISCLLLASCDRSGPSASAKPQIAVIPKGTTHEFWKSVHAGAVKAGNELGVDIVWKGPAREDQAEEQIKVVEDFTGQGVKAIVLAPLNDQALVAPVEAAVANKIPVVIIDSDLKSDHYTSFCATDNFKGGQMAGEALAKLIGGKGKVVLLRYAEGSASTTNRENGFLDAIGKIPAIEVVVKNEYGGATAESAQQKSENILAPLKNADGSLSVDGIFCCNESTTFGMLRALEEAKAAGKVKFVGFDASSKLVDGLTAGEIDALVVQNPMNMGYVGVTMAVKAMRGQPVDKRVDTGAMLVTKANMAEPAVNDLLHPPLSQYLKEWALPRLEMLNIRKRFGGTIALDGVNFAVEPGSVHALVGENGAGKSTLMKILAGAIAADDGSMRLEGQPYTPRNPMDARRSGVAMIYQELSLCPHLSVEDNILLGMEPTFGGGVLNRREIRRRARESLDRLGHGDISPNISAGLLSTARQQLVEIARAIAVGSRVLVFDEPTSSLSQADAQKLFELIDALKADGHAIVYISHFLEEVRRVSDVFTVLRDGNSVGGGRTADVSTDKIVAMMVGREVTDLYPRSQRKTGDVALDLSHLAGQRKPVDATLSLRRGEVLGIAGLMGAGRTELLRTIFGLDPIRRGDVQLLAFHGAATPSQRWQQGAGMLSEDRKNEGLALNLSIADNLTLSRLSSLIRPAKQQAAAQRWMQRIGVRARSPLQAIGQLSGGNQQKVAIARLLHHDVDVLLLDEPTRGIDVASKAEIYRLIDELACAGKAILMVSSYLPELLGVCDRIAVMCRGVLGPARAIDQVDAQQIMLEATGT